MESFHDVRFPLAVSFGATGGPERRNEIVLLSSGAEKRNARLAYSRRRYDAGTGIRSLEDLYNVLAFFEARRGSLHAFRFRDPFDMKSCRPQETPAAQDQEIGQGDGAATRFVLIKIYGEGADAYSRPIRRPVAGSLLVAVDGTVQQGGEDFSFDTAMGEVVFVTPPPEGAAITAGYEFDVPVRFDVDSLPVSLKGFKAGQIPSIPLIEVLA